MANHPAIQVQKIGQSLWMDYIHRRELENGEFQRQLDEDGVLGVTSNPAIFQKAIGASDTYDQAILGVDSTDPEVIYETLAIEDIKAAADKLRPIYDRTSAKDGYVSLEVSPVIAHDTQKTISEARRLFAAVDRPNLMIKIPATEAGIPAIEEVIASGINVNVTLIFSVRNYEAVAEAYIRGLERRADAGGDVTRIASVASFFLSRIDSMVDALLDEAADQDRAQKLKGQAAIANAKLAYVSYQRIFEGERFAKLRHAGAQVQRPLWASTGTKNPAYPDTLYVDALIGPNTVNTVPPATFRAFLDHGTASRTIDRRLDGHMPANEVMSSLAAVGIDLNAVTRDLQVDGVDQFVKAFDTLIGQVREKHAALSTS